VPEQSHPEHDRRGDPHRNGEQATLDESELHASSVARTT
jgi:hypothetical protein